VLRKIAIGIAVFAAVLIGVGVYLIYRLDSQWARESREQLQKLQPQVVTGDQKFAKKILFQDSGLGEITQVLVGWPADREAALLTLVGKRKVDFLDTQAALKKQTSLSDPVGAQLQAVKLDAGGDFGFLTRDQSWASDVILLDDAGQEVWKYPDGVLDGVDDSTAGELGPDGKLTVVVGFNGGGGIVLLNSQGKKIWQKPEGNVWHVETLDIKRDGHREILHTNARGQLLVRDANGEILTQYLPGHYVSDFSLTRWGDESQPTHILVPTTENDASCCRNELLVLDAEGNRVAGFDAAGDQWIHQTSGSPVRGANKVPFYAVLQSGTLPRSLLSIYDSDAKIEYQEILGERCLAIAMAPGELQDRLLVGCESSVWEYSPRTISPTQGAAK
jgi:hypothetical protein